VTTLDELRLADMVVEDCKAHAGQWTIVACWVPRSYGRPYERRGCQVVYREVTEAPGLVDVIIRWPTTARSAGRDLA
jgi:hypothetical protein